VLYACGASTLVSVRRRRMTSAALTVAAAATLALVGALPGSGRSDRGAPPVVVAVTVRDDGCGVARTALPQSVSFRIVNRGRFVHVFSVDRRQVRVPPGRTALLHVEFTRGRRHVYACSRRALPAKTGQLVVTFPAIVTPTVATPCGVAAAPPIYRHVVWIVFENKTYAQIIGSVAAPYLNRLASQCGVAESFYAEAHPSLPNYIAMTSGGTQGITDDAGPRSHPVDAESIFTQLGKDWRALQESMPSNCSLSDSSFYAVRHNPAVYYPRLRTACATQDVPLAETPDLSARFTFITPNTCHDMHSSSCGADTSAEVRQGDSWLEEFLPKVLASSQYRSGSTAVFVTWDEDDHSKSNGQHIPMLVIAPSVPPGTAATARFDHYALLRTTEELLGLNSFLGAAATAPTMRAAFHL
jgi:hypothetical protein